MKEQKILKFETKKERRLREIEEQFDKIEEEYNEHCVRCQLRLANSNKVTQTEKDLAFEQFCSYAAEMIELKEEKEKLLEDMGEYNGI